MIEKPGRTAELAEAPYPLPNPYSHNTWHKNWGQISEAANKFAKADRGPNVADDVASELRSSPQP